MIEFLQHLFGLCPDHMSHFNLIDGGIMSGGFVFVAGAYAAVRSRFSFRRKHKHDENCKH